MARHYPTLIFVAVVITFCATASGNGGFKQGMAFAEAPAIPVQRAMIVWRDGVQTLIVESAFETSSPNVGWVLPLPAEPTQLDVADRDMLASVSMSLQPQIVRDASRLYPVQQVKLSFLIVLLGAVVMIAWPLRLGEGLALVAIVVVLAATLLPSLSQTRSAAQAIEGVAIHSTQRLGSYDAAVLRAQTGEALSAWLEAHDLASLDAAEEAIIDDYIARGWCFLVAHLTRDTGGEAMPNPIVATFPVQRPVYPMKLTSIGGVSTTVELFVVSDDRAVAERFTCVTADRYFMRQWPTMPRDGTVDAPWYDAETIASPIGNPDAGQWLWGGCVVTKLVAELAPGQMGHDVEISFQPSVPHRRRLFSDEARGQLATMTLAGGGILILLTSAIMFRARRRPGQRQLLVLVALLAATGAAGLAMHSLIPAAAIRTVPDRDVFGEQLAQVDLARQLVAAGVLHSAIGEAELDQFIDRYIEAARDSRVAVNPFTGERMAVQRTPGNISLRTIDGVTYFCMYDAHGRETRMPLPPAAQGN